MNVEEWHPARRASDLVLPADEVHVWRASATDRDQARSILRQLLAGYEHRTPQAIAFKDGPHGKPELNARTDLRFNMSHTKGLALYAFARGTEVGVDVERARGGLDTIRVARRFMSPEEAERLERLEPAQRDAAFLRAWVRYEATVKCLGTGIGGRNIQRTAADTPPWVLEFDPGSGAAAAAVAVADGPRRLELYEWATSPEP
jgi:phosphopantetheinyl transferase